MEDKLVLLDTGVLIDYFRKKDKSKSLFYQLAIKRLNFSVSVITKYEILVGSNAEQNQFWNLFFEKITVIPFDEECCQCAVSIYQDLRSKNKLVQVEDILIGSTAIAKKLELVTLNEKHFNRFDNIKLLKATVKK